MFACGGQVGGSRDIAIVNNRTLQTYLSELASMLLCYILFLYFNSLFPSTRVHTGNGRGSEERAIVERARAGGTELVR